MTDAIKPDKKLLTKNWMIFLTISLLLVLGALLMQIMMPLNEDVDPRDLAAILWPVTFGCILAMWLVAVPIVVLWVKNLSYVIGEERITIMKGVLTKVQKNIPYRAITDFALQRSLFDRMLGIASIRIQTAGQSQTATGYEGNMAGLLQWDSLHQNLRRRIKTLHPKGESLTTREVPSMEGETAVFHGILDELRAIRKTVENINRHNSEPAEHEE